MPAEHMGADKAGNETGLDEQTFCPDVFFPFCFLHSWAASLHHRNAPTSLSLLLRVSETCQVPIIQNYRSCCEHNPEICSFCSSTPRALLVLNPGYPSANLRLGAAGRSKCDWFSRERSSTAEKAAPHQLLHIRTQNHSHAQLCWCCSAVKELMHSPLWM